jgi:hypothetical protein
MSTYCVVLRPRPSLNPIYSRPKRYYLRARSAVQAIFLASEDTDWLVIGVEPAVIFSSPPPGDHSGSTETLHFT